MKLLNKIFKDHMRKEYRQEFSNSNIEIDIHRSRIMLALILFIESIFLLCTFSENIGFNYDDYLSIYRAMYFIMIAVSIILLVLINIFNKQSGKIRLKGLTTIGSIFILFLFIWGAVITALDISRGISSSVYLYFVLTVSIFVFLRPINSLVIYLISYIVYYILITIIVGDRISALSGVANGATFVITAWVISVTQYQSRKRQFLSDKIILEKTNQLSKIADIDPLTNAYNRRSLDRILKEFYSNSMLAMEEVSVMMMDIDYFKEINDRFGHICGDEVLVQISSVVKKAVRPYNGQVFRYGGDEFCILFLGIDETELNTLAKKIKSWTIDLQIESKNSKPDRVVTISIGYSKGKPDTLDEVWDIISKADKELYMAKSKRLHRRKSDSDVVF